ncbi:MAG: hypothetical protein P4L27_05325 [Ignavibacteriaceae bacterium]|nr:hypothetical protein [Ignavibacteriaceae bacterium]
MKKLLLLILLVISFEEFPQTRGGWNYEAGLESIVGVGNFSGFIPFSLGPVATAEFKFPFSYFSVGGSMGVLFASEGTSTDNLYYSIHKLTSFKIGLQSKVQLGNSPFAISIDPILLIPLSADYIYNLSNGPSKETYYSVETSCLAKIDISSSISTLAKLGIGMVGANGMDLSYYINFGLMIQGSIGY